MNTYVFSSSLASFSHQHNVLIRDSLSHVPLAVHVDVFLTSPAFSQEIHFSTIMILLVYHACITATACTIRKSSQTARSDTLYIVTCRKTGQKMLQDRIFNLV
jgi:hypothetical protein